MALACWLTTNGLIAQNPQYVGNAPDLTGCEVYLCFYDFETDNQWHETLTSADYSVSPSVFSSAGSQTVTLSYTGSSQQASDVTDYTETVTVIPGTIIKNIYVFTEDGRKAIWGTIEAT